MSNTATYKIIKGTIPVLVSAPHVYCHRRPSLTLSYKLGEPWTDNIVEEICANTGAWGILHCCETDYDPNYQKLKKNPYKQEIANIIEREKIKKFVDIHGLSDEHEYDVGIYFPERYINSIRLSEGINKALNKGGLKGVNCCMFKFEDDKQETLGEFVACKLKVPSIQVEVARYIREKDGLRNAFIENMSSYLRV
jgi:hypothetical protein